MFAVRWQARESGEGSEENKATTPSTTCQQRAHPPHQQQNSQARNFSKEQAPVQHRHHNNHHNHSAKKELPPGWPPRKVTPATAHVPQKTVLPPSPLFTFTPLKVAKAETPNNKPKHIEKDAKLKPEKDAKLKPKKENAEANVKVGECKKKKGNFLIVFRRKPNDFIFLAGFQFEKWAEKVPLASAANPCASTPPLTRAQCTCRWAELLHFIEKETFHRCQSAFKWNATKYLFSA